MIALGSYGNTRNVMTELFQCILVLFDILDMFAHQMVFQVISSRVCGATEMASIAGTQRRKWTRGDRSLVVICLHCMKLKKIHVLIQLNYFGFW